MIPRSFIEDLVVKCDLVRFIGNRVKLKAKGSKYFGVCPFHKEDTPSFVVNQKEQFYYCFGCHVHGNILDFIMHFERLNFKDAVVYLANYLNLPLPAADVNSQRREGHKKKLLRLCQEVALYYQQCLGRVAAHEYLMKRGISQEIIKFFGIGYALPYGNYLKKFPECYNRYWGELGVLNSKGDFPRFHDRIMFPIRNEHGQIVGFGGRTLKGSEMKYLNSPETMLFHKREELYGLYEVKQKGNFDEIIVVEGYFDVISLHQFGITNVVATLGTAVSQIQVRKIINYAKKIIFCFDGDIAGVKAAKRAMELLLPMMQEGIKGIFVFLPVDEDPDSFIRKVGAIKFKSYLSENGKNLVDFLIETMKEGCDLNLLEGKVEYSNRAKLVLKNLSNTLFKSFLLERIAKEVNVSPEKFSDCLTLDNKGNFDDKRNFLSITEEQKKILKLCIYYPQLLSKLTLEQNDYLNQINNEIFKDSLALIRQNKFNSIGSFLEYWRDYNLDFNEVLVGTLLNEEQALVELIELIMWSIENQKKEMIGKLIRKLSNSKDNEERIMLQKMIYDLKFKTGK